MLWKACALLFFVASIGSSFGDRNNITAAKIWLEEYNTEAEKVRPEAQEASWTWNTNITDYNNRLKLEAEKKKSEFDKRSYNQTLNWDWKNFTEINAKRQFYKIADIGESVLPTDKFQQITKAKSNMQSVYSKARVCNKPGDQDPSKCYPLNPTLENIMAKSTDWKELAWAWEGWRNETGRKMPDDYEKFVELANEAAGMNGYTDNGDYWRSWYETENFEKQMEELFIGLKDLYKLLHAYARKKLKERFVGHPFPDSGQIPAHLLGNMWAQSWGNLFTLLAPYPGKPLDVTEMMREQNYTTRKMFDLSEKFFTDLGLDPMPPKFYNDSMLDKPEDGRDVVCHASAWDFYNRKDFRIKQCTQVTMDWLITTHHEMGHVQYFLQYKDQPVVFRRGANPGFHEAIGDVLALSVSTPKHLKKINLLRPNQNPDDEELQLNFLMNQALKKIAFIPFGYLIDQWRWKVFKGETKKDEYNEDWWNLRCKHQGVSPPVQRFNTDFDAGSKFHVPNNTPYIRYFVSYVIQFQFHKALCKEAGHNGPLHKCDIDQSTEAGNKLAAMMKLGSSKEWPDAMEAITGQRKMNVSDLIEYFAPLEDWLKKEVKNETLGWDDQCGRIWGNGMRTKSIFIAIYIIFH
ncbi:DgyrCDS4720 [Dimorphilus gyrociliatus]|uniref:Angiotensin-converting enzyme n=1 Tax=Dimorphilus gyrociliatus TaxID=2664684 RepID=A0A7I8VMG9_9ANNE|nr:DgyrCDS4720 [Dimorphilus gyrociliatus]